MEQENWRGVNGFPLYEVSDLGSVRSLPRTFERCHPVHTQRHSISWKGRLLRGWVQERNGLPMRVLVALRKDGRTVIDRVHRLVLGAFVGPCPTGMEGCHNDGDPLNNRLDNLRWDTHAENIQDCVIHGTKHKPPIHHGETHPNARLTDAQVAAIRSAPAKRGTEARLAREFSVSQTTIHRIRLGLQR